MGIEIEYVGKWKTPAKASKEVQNMDENHIKLKVRQDIRTGECSLLCSGFFDWIVESTNHHHYCSPEYTKTAEPL